MPGRDQGAQHELLPGRAVRRRRGRRSAGGRPTRSSGPSSARARHGGGRLPRAGAERRRAASRRRPATSTRVREICDRHGVLLVSDEVICAFGRLGHWFGAARYGYQPDIITVAKGLTSGYAPLGAMIASDRLMEPFLGPGASFLHGFTFAGHPVSCAVALANLDVFEGEQILAARAGHRGRVPRRARGPLRPAHRGQRARRRLLLRHRAREGQGHPALLRRRGVRAPAARASSRARCSTPG